MNKKKYLLIKDGDVTQNWLEENHFFWDEARRMYIHRYTIWRIDDTPECVYAEIRLNAETKDVELDVYMDKKTYYGPWYLDQLGIETDEEVVIMNRRIKGEFERLGIIERVEI